ACTEIWVEAGVYKPTTGTDEATSFNIRPGAAVYGGFDGTEDTREERNPVVNTTILSGDIDDDDIDDDGNHIADDYNDLQGDVTSCDADGYVCRRSRFATTRRASYGGCAGVTRYASKLRV